MYFRPLPLMTAITLASFVILILFGNWQWSRYAEKMAAQGGAPDWADITGETLPGTQVRVYAYTDGRAAWRIVTGFDTGEGIVFLPRAIHFTVEPPADPAAGQMLAAPERLSLRGLWYSPQRRNAFTAADDVEAGLYYLLDPERLGTTLPGDDSARVLPLVFEPETLTLGGTASTIENPFLSRGDADRLPPERHFGYAITWWGLAIALIGVYLAFHYQRGRLRFRRETG